MSERPVFVVPEPEEPVVISAEADLDRRMSVIQHLEELRHVLIVSLVAWVIASIAGLAGSIWIVKFLSQPLYSLNLKPVVLSPMGVFTIHLKVGLLAGLVLSLPIVARQVWKFVAPGLKPKERRFALPLLLSSVTLFALGAVLAYLFMYIAVKLLTVTTGWTGITYIPELNAYLGLVVVLIMAFGITFEFPVALVLLAIVGIISSPKLRSWRRQAYFIIAAVGYFITPGVDPVTPLALIVPLLLLYEASIFVIKRIGK